VLWLVWSKHLFGFNGGSAAAHDEALSGEALLTHVKQMTTEFEEVS
jgi:hypothetical protein